MADRRLQVFHAVAKYLSFTKAADALFMTQPAVTFQVKQLEEHFNARLFDRSHGRIKLTTYEHTENVKPGKSSSLTAAPPTTWRRSSTTTLRPARAR